MLDAKEHSRIIADFERVCTVAGIQGRFLSESMTKYCGDDEVNWVRKYWQHKAEGMPGLVLEGITRPDTRCQVIAAALIRNYLDARVVPLNTLMEEAVSPSVLLIPNLYVVAMNKNAPPWRIQVMYDMLLERSTKGKPSVVYVEDMKSLAAVYGVPFADFLSGFRIVHD